MKRIIAVIGLVLVIGAVAAASALGCVSQYSVCAPNNDSNGQSENHAPPRTQKSSVPANQGTSRAADESPAIDYSCYIG